MIDWIRGTDQGGPTVSPLEDEVLLVRAQNSRGIESSGRESNEFTFEHFDIKGCVYNWRKVPSMILALELETLDH